jgi:hypothetical protein
MLDNKIIDIALPLGYSKDRDSIYVDEESFKDNTIKIIGAFNTSSFFYDKSITNTTKFVNFEMSFYGIIDFQKTWIDIYKFPYGTVNNFIQIAKSDGDIYYCDNTEKYYLYVFQTYDWIYTIICQEYSVVLT